MRPSVGSSSRVSGSTHAGALQTPLHAVDRPLVVGSRRSAGAWCDRPEDGMRAHAAATGASSLAADEMSPLISRRRGARAGGSSRVVVLTATGVIFALCVFAFASFRAGSVASEPSPTSRASLGAGTLRLPTFIGSNMVLQRAPAQAVSLRKKEIHDDRT